MIFLLLPKITFASGISAASANYRTDLVTFLSGGGQSSSPGTIAAQTSLGENIGQTLQLSSTNFGQVLGQINLLNEVSLTVSIEVISDLIARTDVLGALIPEKTWTKDNSPYFSWLVVTAFPELIIGYSVSLDAASDHTVDTQQTYYQFAEESISSGKHIFYVLPQTSKWGWLESNMLKFEIWVDVEAPVINHQAPAPGEFISNNLLPISCLLYDRDSGIDLNLITLTLNNIPVAFNYNAETQVLESKLVTALSEGKNTVLIKAYDLAGNYVTKGWDFVVDTKPVIGSVVINNQEEITHSPFVTLNLQAEDEVSGVDKVYISNDGIFDTETAKPLPYAPIISDWLLTEPAVDGIKTVYVKFQDLLGNISRVYEDTIYLKLLIPDTRIISGPASLTESPAADFKFEATKAGCKFSYKLDSGTWSGWSAASEAHFSGLDEGNHHFFVKSAYDLSGDGNISVDEEDSTPSQWAWTVRQEGYLEKLRKRILFWRR